MSTNVPNAESSIPSEFLRYLIDAEVFRRGDVESIASLVRRSSDSWYAKLAATRGVEEADRKLAEWLTARGTYADAVGSAASGLLALAELDVNRSDDQRLAALPPLVRLVPLTNKIKLPGTCDYDGGTLIFGANPNVQMRGSSVFRLNGKLGLQFVGIAVAPDLADPTLLLFLHPPEYRRAHGYESHGYAAIAIDTEGCVSGMTVDLNFMANPIEFVLGLTEPGKVFHISEGIGSQTDDDETDDGVARDAGVETALGFPGADEYLARRISGLEV